MSQREPEACFFFDRWIERRPMLCLAVLWLLLILVIDPRGEFPLNDDWAYSLPIQNLMERGELRLTFWQGMPLLSQLFWGTLFCLPGGFSFLALRCSTLTLGLLGLWALYRLLRDSDVAPRWCLLAALLLLTNPIYVALSFSFMSDVPFLALFVLSAWQLMRALERPTGWALSLGFGLALVATMVRQIGVALPAAFALTSLLSWGLGWRWVRLAFLPLIGVASTLPLSRLLLEQSIGLPALYEMRDQDLRRALGDLMHGRLGVVRMVLTRVHATTLYMGLFLAPITGALLFGQRATFSRTKWLLFAATGLALGALSIALGILVPDPAIGNVLTTHGIGPMSGVESGWVGRSSAWMLTCVAGLGTVGLAVLLVHRVGRVHSILDVRKWLPRRVFVIVTLLLGFAPFALAYGPFFDRYLLFLVPMLILLLLDLPWRAPGRFTTLATLLVITFGALLTTSAVHDYLAWNRARWQAARSVAAALGPLDGGFEYNNYMAHREATANGESAPTTLRDRSDAPYSVETNLEASAQVVARFPVSTWLPVTPGEILIVKRRR